MIANAKVRRRFLVVLGILIVSGAVAFWPIRQHVRAQRQLELGQAALAADRPDEALVYYQSYLQRRPRHAEAHFRAAQAARRCGELVEAERHLDEAAAYGWNSEDIELERALVTTQKGDLRWVESTLARALYKDHPEAPRILAVLVPALTLEFRWVEAAAYAEKWTTLEPESALGWRYRAECQERLLRRTEALAAWRTAVRLAPGDRRATLGLARLLLSIREPADEVAALLEPFHTAEPNNSAVTVQLAMCREAQGRANEAISLLDQLIAAGTTDARVYHHRGRLESARLQHRAAIPYLRRAVELDPSDIETLYSLLQCLQHTGTPAEIQAAEERWKRCEKDLRRVAELSRLISATPRNPDLRCEMGELFLRNGRNQDGIRWLESALREAPNHSATHTLLADHYAKSGDQARASHHRSQQSAATSGGK